MGKRKGLKITGFDFALAKTTIVDIGGHNDTGAATFYGATRTHFGINQGFDAHDVAFDIFGKGFKYQFGSPVPTSGTVKKVLVKVGGEDALLVEGLSLPALDAIKAYQKDDPFAAFAKLLVGDDTIHGSSQGDDLWGGKGDDYLFGHWGWDTVNGFKGNDINDGGPGNDYLADTKGKDWFQFSSGLALTADANLGYNYDTIKKFGKGDAIYLDTGVFLDIGGKLSKAEFHYGDVATSPDQRILFDGKVGYWDRDGSGTGYEAIPFFEVEKGGGIFNHKSFVMGVMHGDGYD
jgi:Ca2+-binding RTX toxin-like protein